MSDENRYCSHGCGARVFGKWQCCGECNLPPPRKEPMEKTLKLSEAVAAMEAGRVCIDRDGVRWQSQGGTVRTQSNKHSLPGDCYSAGTGLCYRLDGWTLEPETFDFAEAVTRYHRYKTIRSRVSGEKYAGPGSNKASTWFKWPGAGEIAGQWEEVSDE